VKQQNLLSTKVIMFYRSKPLSEVTSLLPTYVKRYEMCVIFPRYINTVSEAHRINEVESNYDSQQKGKKGAKRKSVQGERTT